MKLNLGCGPHVIEGWLNVDYAIGARLAKLPLVKHITRRVGLFRTSWDPRVIIHDLTTEFPWPEGSVEAIYSSHTLEHLTRTEGRSFLARCHRVLRPRGIVRIVVPDLAQFVRQYVQGSMRADEFVEKLGVLTTARSHPIEQKLAQFVEHPHKCMYDETALLDVLHEIGFAGSARKPFDSAIGDIRHVEQADRVVDAVIVEGQKAE
jgi:predicted SAM-dependent methyltransferase